jgi:hypothetical protein
LRGQHGAAWVIGRVFDQQLELAAIDAALLVGSSTRSIMPKRTCLPKPASGPDKSWIEPSVISVLDTPCVWAMAAPAVRAIAAATRLSLSFMVQVSCCGDG